MVETLTKNEICSKIKSSWYDLGGFSKEINISRKGSLVRFLDKRLNLIVESNYDRHEFNAVLKWCINKKLEVNFIEG